MRLKVLDMLYEERSWADVVRESQEAVELALNGLLQAAHIETPRVHDVGEALLGNLRSLPSKVQPHADKLAEHSRTLRRDRELAFYGSEDLTPGDFYREKDARAAREMAREVVRVVGLAFEADASGDLQTE